jgi:hypothetical protein
MSFNAGTPRLSQTPAGTDKMEKLMTLERAFVYILEQEGLVWVLRDRGKRVLDRSTPVQTLADYTKWGEAAYEDLSVRGLCGTLPKAELILSEYRSLTAGYNAKLTAEHLLLDNLTLNLIRMTHRRTEYLVAALAIAEASIYEDQPLSTVVALFDQIVTELEQQELKPRRNTSGVMP